MQARIYKRDDGTFSIVIRHKRSLRLPVFKLDHADKKSIVDAARLEGEKAEQVESYIVQARSAGRLP
jgi:hypothetical protein